jgi:hypothetical protein
MKGTAKVTGADGGLATSGDDAATLVSSETAPDLERAYWASLWDIVQDDISITTTAIVVYKCPCGHTSTKSRRKLDLLVAKRLGKPAAGARMDSFIAHTRMGNQRMSSPDARCEGRPLPPDRHKQSL